jgi:hypothetical protein
MFLNRRNESKGERLITVKIRTAGGCYAISGVGNISWEAKYMFPPACPVIIQVENQESPVPIQKQ